MAQLDPREFTDFEWKDIPELKKKASQQYVVLEPMYIVSSVKPLKLRRLGGTCKLPDPYLRGLRLSDLIEDFETFKSLNKILTCIGAERG
jgi:hypothetical protein